MKRNYARLVTVGGLLFAVLVWLYLAEVGQGIHKHSPLCAPIGPATVQLVRYFTIAGATASFAGGFAAFPRWRWCTLALLAGALNLTALSKWEDWINRGMLLPYEQFADKMGWP